MNELLSFSALVAVTTGLTEAIKRGLKLKSRFVPLLALILGVILVLIANLTSITSLTIVTGIAVGLSSSGLYDHKAILGK